MRTRIVFVALLAVGASRGGCDGGAWEPCAGKACGERCTICPPGASDCFETQEVKACDRAGRCVSETAGLCQGAAACEGKACGDACTIDPPCRAATPPCMTPSQAGTCDPSGTCLALGLPVPACPPHPDCVGKACGASCNPCGPERTCPTLLPSACDRLGRCVGDVPGICYDPCAGKACGAACTICPPDAVGCAETLELKACDAAGRCVSSTPSLVCP
jgi:hypothetical protein